MPQEETLQLRSRWVPRITGAYLVGLAAMMGFAIITAARRPRGFDPVLAAALLLPVLLLCAFWWRLWRQRVVLGDDGVLRTTAIRPRVEMPADAIVEARPTAQFMGCHTIVLQPREGAPKTIQLLCGAKEAAAHSATVNEWVVAHGGGRAARECVAVAQEASGEVGDQQLAALHDRRADASFLGLLVLLALSVPTVRHWHPVAWWGWAAGAALLGVAVFLWHRTRGPAGVELRGDKLVLGQGRRVIDASRIARVLSLDAEKGLTSVAVQLDDASTVLLPLPDEVPDDSSTAALLQRWALQHGGGIAGATSPVRRPKLLRTCLVMAVTVVSFQLVFNTWMQDSWHTITAILPIMVLMWGWRLRLRVVRDWSAAS